MATLQIETGRILDNVRGLGHYLKAHGIQWTLVLKGLGGYRPVLENLLKDPALDAVHSVADARLSGVRSVKEIRPDLKTLYLKPPSVELAAEVVAYSDVSLNTSRTTILALNEAAGRQRRRHQILIMVEVGERREGVMREDLLTFYEQVRELPYIEVAGIGANLGCMHGVEPTYDKLLQLVLFRDLIDARYGHPLPIVSGGSSIALPLVEAQRLPRGINHLRIGEAALFGTSPLDGGRFRDLSTTAFGFRADVIERGRKHRRPDGTVGCAGIGQTSEQEDEGFDAKAERRIVDFGLMDVNPGDLVPRDDRIRFAGSTSDMTVYDVEGEPGDYPVGSHLHFTPSYMAVARLMNSRYIEKEVVPAVSRERSGTALRAIGRPQRAVS